MGNTSTQYISNQEIAKKLADLADQESISLAAALQLCLKFYGINPFRWTGTWLETVNNGILEEGIDKWTMNIP